MKERGVPLVPTVYVLDYIIEEGEKRGIPADRIAKAKALQAERDRCLRAAFAAGLTVPLAPTPSTPILKPTASSRGWCAWACPPWPRFGRPRPTRPAFWGSRRTWGRSRPESGPTSWPWAATPSPT
jgi:hypothetical protein